MKKLLTVIISIAVCAISATSLIANALSIMVDTTKYEEWYELEEYIEYTKGKIYRSINNSTEYYLISSTTSAVTGEQINFGPFVIYFDYYALTQNEYLILTEYLSQNYPDIEIYSDNESSENDQKHRYVLDYNSDFSINEKFEIAVDIKENTGFICEHLWLMSEIDATVIEETTTTTTTIASETTTTTTTTKAVASSTTTKKGVDSPKTGDAGLAGVLLAGAGAVAMVFALRKRED